LHHNTALFRELEDLLQQGYADYQSGQQHLEPYAVPKNNEKKSQGDNPLTQIST